MVIKTAQWTSPPDTENELLSWLDEMRAMNPVQRDPERGGWHVFGHAECVAALTNDDAFSSILAGDVPADSPMTIFRIGNLSWMDGWRHQQLRGLVRHVFTPRYVAGLQSMVVDTVERYFGEIEGKEEFSFIDEYAAPIASAVIADMLGIPASDRNLFERWNAALFSVADPSTERNEVATVISLTKDIKQYLEDLVQSRRRAPLDDFISRLVSVEVDGRTLADDEITGLITLLLLTGQTTTLTQVNAVICLDRNPEADRELRADLSLLDGAIDEVMRSRAQTSRVARITTKPVALGNQVIPAGERVSVWLAGANTDPAQFPDPRAFDMRRSPNKHVALGHGVHFCLGAPLARMETTTALRYLLQKTRSLAVDQERTTYLDPRLAFGSYRMTVRATW